MSDQIKITGISATAKHGVFDFEREQGQRFVADVTLFLSLAEAGETDLLKSTVDYGQIAELTHSILRGEPVTLIESLADRIATDILKLGGIDEVEVTIHKPTAPISIPFDDVQVTVRRQAS